MLPTEPFCHQSLWRRNSSPDTSAKEKTELVLFFIYFVDAIAVNIPIIIYSCIPVSCTLYNYLTFKNMFNTPINWILNIISPFSLSAHGTDSHSSTFHDYLSLCWNPWTQFLYFWKYETTFGCLLQNTVMI